jgi:hypothetical protein
VTIAVPKNVFVPESEFVRRVPLLDDAVIVPAEDTNKKPVTTMLFALVVVRVFVPGVVVTGLPENAPIPPTPVKVATAIESFEVPAVVTEVAPTRAL